MKKIDYSLYLCTDRKLMSCDSLLYCVEQAIKGGVTVVQLREKDISSREYYNLGCEIREITKAYNVPLIINDRADVALAVNADGVHLGQSDLDCSIVRRFVKRDMIIGVTAHNADEAIAAQKSGANYLGVGAVSVTSTKSDAKPILLEELLKVRRSVDIPIVIIGGINKNNVTRFKGMGLNGIAVVSAIVAQPDIYIAAKELKELWI